MRILAAVTPKTIANIGTPKTGTKLLTISNTTHITGITGEKTDTDRTKDNNTADTLEKYQKLLPNTIIGKKQLQKTMATTQNTGLMLKLLLPPVTIWTQKRTQEQLNRPSLHCGKGSIKQYS